MRENISRVEIWNQNASQPLIRDDVECYQKGGFYCVFNRDSGETEKFPIVNIFKVLEK